MYDNSYNKNQYLMANKDNWVVTLFKGMAIIGGAWLTIEILKAISKKTVFYDCPVCGTDIEWGQEQCNNCKSYLDWENAIK